MERSAGRRGVLRRAGIQGALVYRVAAGTGADRAGLRGTRRLAFGRWEMGDIIVGIAGQPIRTSADVLLAVEEKKAGEQVAVDLLRDNRRLTVQVVLADAADLPGAVRGQVQ